METIITWKSPKRITAFLISIVVLLALLMLSNYVRSPVDFPDQNLEQVIREKIEKPSGTIFKSELASIIDLDASGRDIRYLDGIEALKRLVTLNLSDNLVSDLTPLSNLKMLRVLNLSNNQMCDLNLVNFSSIENLQIRELDLVSNHCDNGELLRDISHLSRLTEIEELVLSNNHIEDIKPLAHLSKLKSLDLRGNQIKDIEPLQQLTRLKELNLRENAISDLSPLTGLTRLDYLNIHTNPVETGLEVLRNLINLETLIMRNVPIGEAYHFLENLTHLRRLNIRNTGITDVSVIGQLMAAGALQDKPEEGIVGAIDLLDIDPIEEDVDPYHELRQYWDNISLRLPLRLPYYHSSVNPPGFSHDSGFYKKEFYLTLSSDEADGKIFYTLDGSDPALTPDFEPLGTTIEYDQPILLQNRRDQPNVLANIRTVSLWAEYVPPSEVFKGNVIRAIVLDSMGNRSDVITQSYFIDEQMTDRYSMPIVSISTNPDYLFDDEIGIYVPGNLYIPLGPDQRWSEDNSNFFQRGLKWERPVHFQMFDLNGNEVLGFDAGIRIHGNFTRLFNQKSLRLYAREEYDGKGLIGYDFFPDLNGRVSVNNVETFETLIIRNGGNSWLEAYFRDVLAHSLLEHTKLDIQGFMPVIVFINGEYWGIHNIRTRYDEHYFSSYYRIDPEELVVLNNAVGNLYVGNPGDEDDFLDLLKLIDENYIENDYQTVDTLSNQDLYDEFVKRIDIDNYIDNHIAHIYFKNTDWPHNNVRIWRKNINPSDSIPVGNSDSQDGKWRWLFMDADHGFMNPSHNTLLHATTVNRYMFSTFLTRSLLENEQFRTQFINNFADHLNTSFREEVVLERIEELEKLYDPEIKEQIHRWGNLGGSYEAWQENVEEIREFARLRPMIIRQHIIDYFDLDDLTTLSIQTDPTKGYIRINTINLTENAVGVREPGHWTGIYFKGIPVEIEAVAFEGYRFVRWEGIDTQSGNNEALVIILNFDIDLKITAVFDINNNN
jgi:hypothetical protein